MAKIYVRCLQFRSYKMNSQLSSCIVHVWLSMGKFFRSMGQERVSVSLENRDSSTIMALEWCVKWKGDTLTRHASWIPSYPTALNPQHQPSPDYVSLKPILRAHPTLRVTSNSSNLAVHLSMLLRPAQTVQRTGRCWQTTCQPLWRVENTALQSLKI